MLHIDRNSHHTYTKEYCKQATKVLHECDGIFINTGCLHSAKGIDEGSVLAGFVFPITFFDSKSFENLYNQNIRLLIESGITNLVLQEKDEKNQALLSSMKELCAITNKEIRFELHSIEMVCRIWRLLTIRVLNDENKEYRMSMASMMLASTNKTVSDIAFSCGFNTKIYRW